LVVRANISLAPAILIACCLLLYLSLIAGALIESLVRPLQTLSNVVASLREGDYSFRARGAGARDPLGELAAEINALADLLQRQRGPGRQGPRAAAAGRCEPAFAGRGTGRVEAPDPRPGTRAFEFPSSHQVHCRQPAGEGGLHGRRGGHDSRLPPRPERGGKP